MCGGVVGPRCHSASPRKGSDAEMTIKTKLKTKALLHDFHLNVTCSQVVSTLAECHVHNQVWGACWPSYEQQAMGMTCSVLCRCSREVIRRKSSLHDSFTAVNEHSTSGVNGPYPSLYSLLQGNLISKVPPLVTKIVMTTTTTNLCRCMGCTSSRSRREDF